VDFAAQAQKASEYLKLNPLGQVPTLIVDDQPCAETAALLMLLAERHPKVGLAPPPGSPGRAKYLGLMVYLANSPLPAFRAWFYPQDFGDAGRTDEVKENARARIETAFQRLDAQLSNERPFLLDNSLSAPDILVTMLARWSRNMPKPADHWPNFKPYLERMKRRDGLRETHAREGLTDWIDTVAA
jgi:glutathione S-transferase